MGTLKFKMMAFFLLLGGLSTLNAQQSIVVIGEVKNIEEGTIFSLEETNGTGSTRMFSKDDP